MLIEILITVAVAAIVLALGASLIYASLQGGINATKQNAALGLAQEEVSGVVAAATQQWQNIYNLNQGTSTDYYATTTSGSWTVATGTDQEVINNITFTRFFIVQGVCRATSTDNITGISDSGGSSTSTCNTNGGQVDPSTELVTAEVTSSNMNTVSLPEFVTRWRDEACAQGSWSSISSATTSCVTASAPTTYQAETDVSASSGLQLCIGGC